MTLTSYGHTGYESTMVPRTEPLYDGDVLWVKLTDVAELQAERDAKERQLRELQGERDTFLAELNALKADAELRKA